MNHTDDYSEKSHRAMMMAVEALEQEPCKDCVSRKTVLEQTYNWSKDELLRVTNPFDYLRKRINSLPSVNTEQKTGHWLCDSDSPDRLICSTCNSKWNMWRYESKELKYCPNCGARMIESEGKE